MHRPEHPAPPWPSFGSHAPVLVALAQCDLDLYSSVLEFGGGMVSTPILRELVRQASGTLTTIEPDGNWHFAPPPTMNHTFMPAWPRGMPLTHATLAFIDGAAHERADIVRRLYNSAGVIVVHDTEEEHAHLYNWGDAISGPRTNVKCPFYGIQTTVLWANYSPTRRMLEELAWVRRRASALSTMIPYLDLIVTKEGN